MGFPRFLPLVKERGFASRRCPVKWPGTPRNRLFFTFSHAVSSYQVFARKYRPQTFDTVIGQEHITQTLKNAITTQRLAHAYLFVGPRGTGKTSTARILAKALNCVEGPTVNPCGVCDVCREIAAGNSLDVLEIDGASNNGVEQVRELRENVRFAPTRGKFKLYIIDEVHMLTTAAFNALLKTLEEPPEHVKFIFATTDVQKVLPTILSRCQRFDLRRIPSELIAGHLQYIAGEEGITLQPEAARAIAKGADGGLRDAESMLDQLVAFCGDTIEENDVLSVFGFTAAETVSILCDHLLDENSSGALAMVHEQAEAGRDLSRLMGDLIGHLRNVLVAKADPEGIKTEVSGDDLARLQEQAESIALDRLLDLIEQFAAAEGRMKWAPNKKLHFEIAVIKAIQTLGQATISELLDTLTAIRTGTEPPPLRTKRTPRAPASSPPPASPRAPSKPPAPKAAVSQPSTPKAAALEPVTQAPAPRAPEAAEQPPAPVSAKAPAGEPVAPAAPPKETPPWHEPEPEPKASSAPPEPPTLEPPAPSQSAWRHPQDPPQKETPPAAPVPQPKAEESPAQADPDLLTLWIDLLCEVRDGKPLIRAWIETGRLVEVCEGNCTIAFPPECTFQIESLSKPSTLEFLEEALSQRLGRPITLRLITQPGLVIEPIELPEKVLAPSSDPMELFKNDPLIKKALELFRAEIE